MVVIFSENHTEHTNTLCGHVVHTHIVCTTLVMSKMCLVRPPTDAAEHTDRHWLHCSADCSVHFIDLQFVRLMREMCAHLCCITLGTQVASHGPCVHTTCIRCFISESTACISIKLSISILHKKANLEDLGVDGKIILKLILEKYDVSVWAGFIWQRGLVDPVMNAFCSLLHSTCHLP